MCKRFAKLIREDCVWRRFRRTITIIKDQRENNHDEGEERYYTCETRRLKDHVRVATNWKKAIYKNYTVLKYRVRQMPWMCMDNHYIWITHKNHIRCFYQKCDGLLQECKKKQLQGHSDDVCHFVSRDDTIVSGSRDKSICGWNALTGEKLFCHPHRHTDEVTSVDFQGDIMVSGSRDSRLKIWSMSQPHNESLRHSIAAQDRVWSVAMSPGGCSFASGTAGCRGISPLRLWDLNTGRLSCILDLEHRNGAGVLDMHYDTPTLLLTGGYDTYVRMWDTRIQQCVIQWEEPYDSAIYCLKSDGHNAIVTGTARYGMVRVWDKRKTQHVQMYYTARDSSPVYSLAFDSAHLYVALDRSIKMLDFNVI